MKLRSWLLSRQALIVAAPAVAPHASTLMHRHRHDYVSVTLGASEVENDVADKPPVTHKLQDGETEFTPGNFAHVAKNFSDRPFRNVTIEALQDAKARKSPLPNGTRSAGFKSSKGEPRTSCS